MGVFERRGEVLFAGEVPLKELAVQYGTPLYVYSYEGLFANLRRFKEAFGSAEILPCYAVKANGNLSLLRIIASEGFGADVVSGGELFLAQSAGIPSSHTVFSGVGKTTPELEYAVRRKVRIINIESEGEIRALCDVSRTLGARTPIALRINPDIDPKTHPYIATGLKENKFGLPMESARALYKEFSRSEDVEPMGLAFHIGSQVRDLGAIRGALRSAVELVRKLRKEGLSVKTLDVGGGFAVSYRGEESPSIGAYAEVILEETMHLDLDLIVEPGRSIVADAGVLVTRVVRTKGDGEKQFVIVDAAMNDLLRPALYQAEHDVRSLRERGGAKFRYDIVGPICESADFLALDRELEAPHEGDLLCVMTTGAYGYSMASQYNARPRAAEVLVKGNESWTIRRRETFDDLVRGEEIPECLRDKL